MPTLIVRSVVADLLAAWAQGLHGYHHAQRHIVLRTIARHDKRAVTSHLRLGTAHRRSLFNEVRERHLNVGALRVQALLEIMQDCRQTSRGDLTLVLGQHLEKSAHMRALEMMRKMHGHRDVSHSWHKLAVLIHHTDRIAKIGNADLINRYASGVWGALDVFHFGSTARSVFYASYSAHEEAVSQTFTETSRTSSLIG